MWVAVDYGKVRVGLAVAVAGPVSAAPAGILRYPDGPYVKKRSFRMVEHGIRDLVADRREPLEGVVLGDPGEDDDGSRFLRMRIVALAEVLKQSFAVPVVLQDESFSSRDAQESLDAAGISAQNRRLDDLAACVVLRRYLEKRSG